MLRAGRHVVLEKPFALSVNKSEEMAKEAKKRDLLLTTYHNRHWDGRVRPSWQAAKDREAVSLGVTPGSYSEPGTWCTV